ncbi:DUF3427 domain-containing protein [Streptosporangium sp. NPDC048047]|uniref:DUF3427 domain-containing protein n=1 Tax=Streptosporangium sp. NPDC048047 TaxID=3155748 RepID=UPI00342CFF2C
MTSANRPTWKELQRELRKLGDVTLTGFLNATEFTIEDLYRNRGGWTALRRAAGLAPAASDPARDAQLGRAFGRMLHIDDTERLSFMHAFSESMVRPPETVREHRMQAMLDTALWGGTESHADAAIRLNRIEKDRRAELGQLAEVLRSRARTTASPLHADVPLCVHARYSKNEVLAAFGVDKPAHMREGVKYVAQHRADVFFVTIDKAEKDYTESTRYSDYAITQERFHWESQSGLRATAPTAERYIKGLSTVHLMIRRSKHDEGWGTPPYTYAGPMRYISHKGERPIGVVWRLDHALPSEVFQYAKAAPDEALQAAQGDVPFAAES